MSEPVEPTATPPPDPSSRLHRLWIMRDRLKPALAVVASLAAGGAILSGLTGYWTTFRTLTGEIVRHEPKIAADAEAGRRQLSLAVLPFENLDRDPSTDYLADALVVDLTSNISTHVPGLMIVGSAATLTFRRKSVELKQAARELGVRYLVTGNMQRAGRGLRVGAQLIDGATNAVLWADRFEEGADDLLAVQDRIVQRLAASLGFEITIQGAKDAERKGRNTEASDLVLRARAARYDSRGGLQSSAEKLYRQALALEPDNADALIELGDTLAEDVWLQQVSGSLTPELVRQISSQAQDFIDRGAGQRRGSATLHHSRAILAIIDRRWSEAKPQVERCLAIDPNHIGCLSALGAILTFTGEPENAVLAFQAAFKRTAGRAPGEAFMLGVLGLDYVLLSQWDDAIATLQKALLQEPNSFAPHLYLAAAHAQRGNLEQARLQVGEVLKMAPRLSLQRLRNATTATDAYVRLRDPTLYEGLRKAGFPEASASN